MSATQTITLQHAIIVAGSPLETVTLYRIRAGGLKHVQQLMRSLPAQMFAGEEGANVEDYADAIKGDEIAVDGMELITELDPEALFAVLAHMTKLDESTIRELDMADFFAIAQAALDFFRQSISPDGMTSGASSPTPPTS